MDILYFLQLRTDFIQSHYDTCLRAFEAIKSQIEEGKPPFDNPVYDESGEPPFLEEWMDAESSIQISGRTCVSLLADALKLYLNELQRRQLRFSFTEEEAQRLKKGFEAGGACFAGRFPDLEDELAGLVLGGGYEGPGRSPDRADAMVWALTELLRTPPAPRVRGL